MAKRLRKFPGLLAYIDSRLGKHTGRGPEYQYYCPFCIDRMGSESSKRTLWLNADKGKAICYRCDYGAGGLSRLFRDINGGALRFEELALLKGEISIPEKDSLRGTVVGILYGEDGSTEHKPIPLPPENIPLAKYMEKDNPPMMLRRGINYLKRRGISPRLVETFHVGYCPTGTYAQRLVFPVHQNGEQVYFTTRYAGKAEKKSLNPPNEDGFFTRNSCLLNYDGVVGARTVGIVEGPFDCMAYPHAVGLMGKVLSDMQVSLLEALAEHGTTEFVVSLDSTALAEADEIYHALLGRVPKVSVLQLGHGDPHDRRGELTELIETRGTMSLSERTKSRLTRHKKTL